MDRQMVKLFCFYGVCLPAFLSALSNGNDVNTSLSYAHQTFHCVVCTTLCVFHLCKWEKVFVVVWWVWWHASHDLLPSTYVFLCVLIFFNFYFVSSCSWLLLRLFSLSTLLLRVTMQVSAELHIHNNCFMAKFVVLLLYHIIVTYVLCMYMSMFLFIFWFTCLCMCMSALFKRKTWEYESFLWISCLHYLLKHGLLVISFPVKHLRGLNEKWCFISISPFYSLLPLPSILLSSPFSPSSLSLLYILVFVCFGEIFVFSQVTSLNFYIWILFQNYLLLYARTHTSQVMSCAIRDNFNNCIYIILFNGACTMDTYYGKQCRRGLILMYWVSSYQWLLCIAHCQHYSYFYLRSSR